MNRTRRSAFTLVELLVVITIIGILIALLLPAVQAAREAARRMQCSNNLKQLGLAMLNHEQAHGFFPGGGWGYNCVAEPDRGTGKRQPGGWIFCILPYIEQNGLHQRTYDEIMSLPVPMMNCPSRRTGGIFPHKAVTTVSQARSCYAANLGDVKVVTCFAGPGSDAEGDSDGYWQNLHLPEMSGISYLHSEVTMAAISDGASNTYCLGEKNIDPDYYLNGYDPGDDSSMYTGQQEDTYRSSGYPNDGSNPQTYTYRLPMQDTPGLATYYDHFGSAHSNACNFVLCDGSVRNISYSIDGETHRRLSNRHDGLPVDGDF